MLSTSPEIKKYLSVFIVAGIATLLVSCSSGKDTPKPLLGSASFGLSFERPPMAQKANSVREAGAIDICVDYGITTVTGYAYDATKATLHASNTFPCSDHQGTITGIPVGSGIVIVVKGFMGANEAWRGEITGVTIAAGNNNIGSAVMNYVGTDNTSPIINTVSPLSNATFVPVTSPVTAVFSEDMARDTVDSTSFTITKETQDCIGGTSGSVSAVTGTVTYDAATRTARFIPGVILENCRVYTAALTTAITDMARLALASVTSWKFTTEPTAAQLPAMPIGVTATASTNEVAISWNAVSGATSYRVYYDTSTGVTRSSPNSLVSSSTSTIHTGLTNGSNYYYVVTAQNAYGESAASSEVTAQPIAIPGNVTATNVKSQTVEVAWTAATGAVSYDIYTSTSSAVSKATGSRISGATSPHRVPGLTNGTPYYFVVTGVNATGESLESSPTMSTVPDRIWGTAQIIETDAMEANSSRLSIDPSGNVFSLWTGYEGPTYYTDVNIYSIASNTWGTAMRINTSGNGITTPQITTDPFGNAFAVWSGAFDTKNHIYSKIYSSSSSAWGPSIIADNGGFHDAHSPAIGADSNGNVVLVWLQSDNGTVWTVLSNVYSSASKTWGAPVSIVADTAHTASQPRIAVDPAGNAIAVWHQTDGTRENVWSNVYDATAKTWGIARVLETDNVGWAMYPDVAIDASGNAIAVWEQYDGTRSNILTNIYSASSKTWGTASLLETDNTFGAVSPHIAMNPTGDAVAVWQANDGGPFNVWAVTYSATTKTWSDVRTIADSNITYQTSEPLIAIDLSGNAVVVWSQSDGTTARIWSNIYSRSTKIWGTARVININNGWNASFPQVQVDHNGNAAVSWLQYEPGAGRTRVWSNRYE